jgi:invasion protein IalB
MRSLMKTLCLMALFGSAGMAMAQEATTDPAPLDVGAPYVTEEFSDWSIRCITAPEGQEDPCNLYQLLLDPQGTAVAELNLFKLPAGAQAVAGATIVVPLETLLTEGVIIAVDGQNARSYPFNFCNRAGCVARIGLTQDEIDEMKRGIAAAVRIVPAAAPDQIVLLDISLLGFTAGYDAIN